MEKKFDFEEMTVEEIIEFVEVQKIIADKTIIKILRRLREKGDETNLLILKYYLLGVTVGKREDK